MSHMEEFRLIQRSFRHAGRSSARGSALGRAAGAGLRQSPRFAGGKGNNLDLSQEWLSPKPFLQELNLNLKSMDARKSTKPPAITARLHSKPPTPKPLKERPELPG